MSETTARPKLTVAQRRKRKILTAKLVRAGIQLFFFLAMPGAFAAGFNGVKTIFQTIGSGGVLEGSSFVLALAGLCAFTVLFGRFFCGYACAFGSMGDLVHWLSALFQKKILKKKKVFAFSPAVLRWLQKIKYVNLVFIVVLCMLSLYSVLNGNSPWDVFSRTTSMQGIPEGYTVGIVLLVLVIAGFALQERFFCQVLCPMGAVFALLPTFPFAFLQRKSENCIKGCDACRKQCPVGIKLEKDGLRNGECISCEKCTGVCPKGNISRTELRVLKNEYVSLAIRAILFFALGCWLGLCRFL